MTVYAVTMYIEAKNEISALDNFSLVTLSGEYNREDLEVKDVEKELEADWSDDLSDWEDEDEWDVNNG